MKDGQCEGNDHRQNFKKEGICVSARRNSHCRITKIYGKFGTGGMASPVPNRQMYECRKIVMVRLLPSLGGDKGYTAGITTYHTTTTVTRSGNHRGKGDSRKL